MSRGAGVIGWLEDKSDWLSPLVVKEVRQVVRAREFNLSFAACLAAGLAIAFFGAADALTGRGTAGNWTFVALIVCLGFLGLAVVPLGAFSALRHEQADQTLELITLTALSPRRVVLGKLMAHAVKLATLFAAIAPFIAMSFLLGGIDVVTILISLVVLFMWSVWMCAACVFLSTLFKSRAMSGVVFAGIGVLAIGVLIFGRTLYLASSAGVFVFSAGVVASSLWWTLAIMTTFWMVSLVNLVLLGEHRLSLPSEDRVTRLRVGFFAQFLLVVVWTLTYLNGPAGTRAAAGEALAVIGSLHLAFVALFTVTEDLVVPRRVLFQLHMPSPWGWLMTMFRPGGGRGALYVLVQMALLLAALTFFQPSQSDVGWLLAACSYICFFTGVPTLLLRTFAPAKVTPLKLRLAVLLLLAMATLLPDIMHYAITRPDVLDLTFGGRHLVNPIRSLDMWRFVHAEGLQAVPFAMGGTGLLAYAVLMQMGRQRTSDAVASAGSIH